MGRRDEQPHRAPGGVDGWSETWSFELNSADGLLGGWVRYVRHDVPGRTPIGWYETALVRRGHQLLSVVDHAVPQRSSPLEIRTDGLWADHVLETPHEHWTIGLETYALGVDDPLELYGRAMGDRVPLGFDLEWESAGPAEATPDEPPGGGYRVPCRVHGEILVGSEALDIDAVGWRGHRWGRLDWRDGGTWTMTGFTDDARYFMADGQLAQSPEESAVRTDAHGLPTVGELRHREVDATFTTVAATPVQRRVDDRVIRWPRALVRWHLATGATGVGWVEHRPRST